MDRLLQHLHPMLVHFPIALLMTSVLFDAACAIFKRDSLREGALWLLILGLLGGIGSVWSGFQVEDLAEKAGIAESLIERHETWALVTMGLFAALLAGRLFLRNRFGPATLTVYLVLAVVGVGTLSVAGYFGGNLVYEHGAGVLHTAPIAPLAGSAQ